MEASTSVNQYPIKSESDQFTDLSSTGPTYHQAYAQWDPQIQQSPVSGYSYAYGPIHSYSSSTQYADGSTMYHQPQTSPTTDSIPPGNPVSVPVTLHTLGYPFGAGSTAYPTTTTTNGVAISRPPSIVHSPVDGAFARARSTSYSGPYVMQPALHQNSFSSVAPLSSFAHPMSRMALSQTSSENPTKQQISIHTANNYYNMMSPAPLEPAPSSASTPYEYMQEDNHSPTPLVMSNNNGMHNQYRSLTPAAAPAAAAMYTYSSIATTPTPGSHSHPHPHPHQQQHQPLPPPIPPLASSVATGGAPTIPRSMSMGSIPGSGSGRGGTASWCSGRNTPSGGLTPGSALSRSHAGRLGVMPSLTIPGSGSTQFHDHRSASEYGNMVYTPSGSSGAVSPPTPTVLSSLIRSGVISAGGGNGTGSGPGTASNGGSVPLTPTTDDITPFEYHTFGGSSHHFSRYGDSLNDGGANGEDDEDGVLDEDDEDDKMTMSIPHLNGGSPRRGVGVTRTPKKRRSTTIAAGPASGATRSRSGTMVGGLVPTNGLSGGSLTMSPVDMHGSATASMAGLSMLGSSSSPVLNGNANGSSTCVGVNGAVGGQANSPLAMKELSPAHKPMIETYLNRYLNYLCMNPNAKDRMGHQIHQMYTARRIQRYEQLYGWRPLKFRIEAFVNGFVDLLTASGLSQDVTMKIPHYLNNSRLFSRFNESGNRMKSQGQTIWRVRARCRSDIPGVDAPPNNGAGFHHHSPSSLSQHQMQQQQQHQAHHHQLIQQQPQHVHQQQQHVHQHQQHHTPDGSTNGLMMAPEPLLWDFLPYERSIVGQPPLAVVGNAWQWNMKVHDHWTPRKKVNWSFVSNPTGASPDNGTASAQDGSDSSSPPLSGSASSSSSGALPKWLSLQGSKLKGTPTETGSFPVSIEATFQEDNDPEPVVVRGTYTIQVTKATGGWKTKVALPHDGLADSPEGDHISGGSADMGYGNDMGRGMGGSGDAGAAAAADASFLIEERTDQLMGMYSANQGLSRGLFHGFPYPFGFVN